MPTLIIINVHIGSIGAYNCPAALSLLTRVSQVISTSCFHANFFVAVFLKIFFFYFFYKCDSRGPQKIPRRFLCILCTYFTINNSQVMREIDKKVYSLKFQLSHRKWGGSRPLHTAPYTPLEYFILLPMYFEWFCSVFINKSAKTDN